jgi:hypothetical protein
MIVALLALVMATAGVAVADPSATTSAINKKKVKKIANKQIANAAPTLSVASADTAGSADIATNVYSANVTSNGTMLGSIPDGATSNKAALGDYRVNFGRNLTGCTISASAASNTGPDLGFVAVGVANANTLQVFTRSPTNVVADRPFYAQAICPAG